MYIWYKITQIISDDQNQQKYGPTMRFKKRAISFWSIFPNLKHT